MRRTRGDIGRRFRFAGVGCAVFLLVTFRRVLAALVLPDVFFAADFAGEDGVEAAGA